MALACISRAQKCITKENQETGAYTYFICTDSNIREFDDIQNYCKKRFNEESHIVTFPNQAEYEFLLRELNNTVGEDFQFYIGVYQELNTADKYRPETGRFYWINDAESPITNNSNTYWKPISDWIVSFDQLGIERRQTNHFLLNADGYVFPAVQLRQSQLRDVWETPGIVCIKEGTSDMVSPKGTTSAIAQASIDLWIIIIIVAGGVLLLVVIGLGIGCLVSKKRSSGDFQKVPSKDPHEPNHNHIQQPQQV